VRLKGEKKTISGNLKPVKKLTEKSTAGGGKEEDCCTGGRDEKEPKYENGKKKKIIAIAKPEGTFNRVLLGNHMANRAEGKGTKKRERKRDNWERQ